MFVYSVYMIINNNWCTSHSGFTTMIACSHFMKMHSYTILNKDYRDDYLDAKKNGYTPISSYPENISFKNFTVYMWSPVLVYQDKFPRTNSFRLGYFLKKVFQFSIGIVVCYIVLSDYIIPYVEMGDRISAF